MSYIKIFLFVINIVSAICVLPFILFGIVEYFQGPEDTKKLLEKWNVPWSYKSILIMGFICLGVLFVSSMLRKILFK